MEPLRTVPICIVQAIFLLSWQMYRSDHPLVQRRFLTEFNVSFWMMGVITLTTGTIFLMWLGEQIDEYGLGNGVSLIILAGIVARMPGAIGELS
jgi:preprotein translocase subunit SecY